MRGKKEKRNRGREENFPEQKTRKFCAWSKSVLMRENGDKKKNALLEDRDIGLPRDRARCAEFQNDGPSGSPEHAGRSAGTLPEQAVV